MVTDKALYSTTIAGLIDYYGHAHLASMLDVREEDLCRWARGTVRPPTDVFLRIIDLANE
jgi:hypothetical protein